MDYKQILHNKEVKKLLKKGNENLGVLGFTDHSEKHCAIVAKRAGNILRKFEHSKHEIELAEIAGTMHDIGNAINRKNHGEYGAIDEEICTMYEYFEIFLGRMMMCRRAAEVLGAKFKLTANGSKIL